MSMNFIKCLLDCTNSSLLLRFYFVPSVQVNFNLLLGNSNLFIALALNSAPIISPPISKSLFGIWTEFPDMSSNIKQAFISSIKRADNRKHSVL